MWGHRSIPLKKVTALHTKQVASLNKSCESRINFLTKKVSDIRLGRPSPSCRNLGVKGLAKFRGLQETPPYYRQFYRRFVQYTPADTSCEKLQHIDLPCNRDIQDDQFMVLKYAKHLVYMRGDHKSQEITSFERKSFL